MIRNKNLKIFLLSLVILVFSSFVTVVLSSYAESFDAPAQKDFFHDLFPLINLNVLATGGYFLVLILLFSYFILKKPHDLPIFIVTISLFFIIRSFLFSVTHLGAPSPRIDDSNPLFLFKDFYFTKDLFPSGHVAIPFIGYLFLKNKIGNL